MLSFFPCLEMPPCITEVGGTLHGMCCIEKIIPEWDLSSGHLDLRTISLIDDACAEVVKNHSKISFPTIHPALREGKAFMGGGSHKYATGRSIPFLASRDACMKRTMS